MKKADIDHNALREWIVKKANAGDCEERKLAERVLMLIYEATTDRQQEYISLFIEEGMSVSEISRDCNVGVASVLHGIKRGLGNAHSALAAELPKELFSSVGEAKAEDKKLAAEPLAEPCKTKIVAWREGTRKREKTSEGRRMPMSEEEIELVYKRADDKRRQIRILADMNVTTCAVIRKILRDRGVFESERKRQNAAQPI